MSEEFMDWISNVLGYVIGAFALIIFIAVAVLSLKANNKE